MSADRSQYENLEDLRLSHQKRLRELEQKAAIFGISTPPEITIEIQKIRLEISEIEVQLGVMSASLTLRDPVADFVGRTIETERVIRSVYNNINSESPVICGIRGMGGVGKTELACASAKQLADLFPDGQLWVDLRGTSNDPLSSSQAIQQIIRALGYDSEPFDNILQLQTKYQKVLSRKKALILADDAKDANQIKPLIPPAGCLLLITSRQRFTLPKLITVDLSVLPADKAIILLLNICPRISNYAPYLAKLCGYLPLALRVSAIYLVNNDTQNVSRYMEQLEAERLKYLVDPDNPDDPGASVEASLQLSYRTLPIAAQQVLCQLSAFPASFDLVLAKAVVEIPENIESLLNLLRRRNLLEWDEITEMYSLHDLVRDFAAAKSENVENVKQRFLNHQMNSGGNFSMSPKYKEVAKVSSYIMAIEDRMIFDQILTSIPDPIMREVFRRRFILDQRPLEIVAALNQQGYKLHPSAINSMLSRILNLLRSDPTIQELFNR